MDRTPFVNLRLTLFQCVRYSVSNLPSFPQALLTELHNQNTDHSAPRGRGRPCRRIHRSSGAACGEEGYCHESTQSLNARLLSSSHTFPVPRILITSTCCTHQGLPYKSPSHKHPLTTHKHLVAHTVPVTYLTTYMHSCSPPSSSSSSSSP